MQPPNKLEIWGMKLFLARLKSKSPKNYALAIKVAVVIASIAGGYITAYNMGFPHSTYDHLLGQIDNICILITGMAVTLGITAGTNTKDPALMDKEVKANVIQEAVDKGTHLSIQNNSGTESFPVVHLRQN